MVHYFGTLQHLVTVEMTLPECPQIEGSNQWNGKCRGRGNEGEFGNVEGNPMTVKRQAKNNDLLQLDEGLLDLTEWTRQFSRRDILRPH